MTSVNCCFKMCILSQGRHCCCLTRVWIRNRKFSSSSPSANKLSHAGVNESIPSNCQHSPKLSRRKSDKSDFRIAWRIHLSLLVATVACYASAIRGDFVHDDIEAIKQSPDVTGHTSIYQLFLNDFWGRPMRDPLSHKSYRPLTVLSFRWVDFNFLNLHVFFTVHRTSSLYHAFMVWVLCSKWNCVSIPMGSSLNSHWCELKMKS